MEPDGEIRLKLTIKTRPPQGIVGAAQEFEKYPRGSGST